MAIEFSDREVAKIKKDEAIGCGCGVLIPAFVAPFVTNFFGLTPWPVPVLFLGLAIIIYMMKTSTGRLSWKAEVAFAMLGFVASLFVALMIGSKPKEAEQSPPVSETSPTPVPTPTPIEAAKSKQDVRISIDELQDMFAKNQVAGAQFFETHTAIIPGRAVRVREALGTGILIIQSPQTGRQMEIGFNDKGTRQLGAVKPGDDVEATCPEVNEMMSQIIVACSDISIRER